MNALRAAAFTHENTCDCCGPQQMDADGLYDALDAQVVTGSSAWLLEAVVEAVGNGDLAFLVKQVERHVPGWVTP